VHEVVDCKEIFNDRKKYMVKVIKACEKRLNYLIKMKPPRKAKNTDHLDLENTDEVK
jgi:hypothetical protein